MEQTANQFLGREPMGRLMKQYVVPCIISLLVGALYNIVDQIFMTDVRRSNTCCITRRTD